MSKISLSRKDAEEIEREWEETHIITRIIWRLNTQMVTACAVGAAYMGYSWMSTGWGLNPILAFPVATLLVIIPHLDFWD